MSWRSARGCNGNSACVEVGFLPGGVAVRDSKLPDGPVVFFTNSEWAAFIIGVKNGEFDNNSPTTAEGTR
ncbi:DUF397 domain-containing protein [Nonomuraea typhae]|uniref:DUF397 domain-containing protein n=1 Tax=Nonomuraea typhae TaxID=2603600 RepID=A0ABW7YJ59_9ACTN